MIRIAFLVGASVIAAACVACTPKPPPPPSPPVQHRAQLCTDEASFIESIHIVKLGYDPMTFADPPATDADLPREVEDDLRSAYRLAPDFFRRDVCSLDGVFLDQTPCDGPGRSPSCFEFSWGFRSPNDANIGKRYIAISLSLWSPGRSLRTADTRRGPRMTDFRHAPRLTDYTTIQLDTLLTQLNHLHWTVPPKFDSKFGRDDPANTPGMTVLAVLAHEMGHVRGHDWTKPKPGLHQEYDFGLLLKCSPDGSFYQDSWKPVAPVETAFAAPPWLEFGQTADERLVVHATGPQISDFLKPEQRDPERSQPQADKYQPRHGGDRRVAALAESLNDLYSDSHPWASLLASLTPTEDLVETYALSVLTQGTSTPLRSLRLNIRSPNGQVFQEDVVADLSDKPTLTRKLACVSALTRNYP